MVRFATVGITGLVLAAAASAGQIEIGGPSGLTSTYITSAGGFTEANYVNTMFEGELPSAVPFAGYTTSGSIAAGDTMTDSAGDGGSGVTFAMIANNSVSTNTANFWDGAGVASGPMNTITVPIGVLGVTDVWTMLNLINGATSPARDVNVIFNWGVTPSTITTTLTVKLSNSANAWNAAAAGQVQDGLICTSGVCTGDNGPTVPVGPPFSPSSGVTVDTDNLYNHGIPGDGITGNVVLDDQGFIFSGSTLTTSLADYLINIQIVEPSGSTSSAVGLSAVTVDAAPEPSTVLLLLLAGLGAFGFRRLRRA